MVSVKAMALEKFNAFVRCRGQGKICLWYMFINTISVCGVWMKTVCSVLGPYDHGFQFLPYNI